MCVCLLYTNIRLIEEKSPCIPPFFGLDSLIPVIAHFSSPTTTRKHAVTHNMELDVVTSELANLPYLPFTNFYMASKRVFNKTVYEWQRAVAGWLILGDQKEDPLTCFVVRPTGDGKSLLRDVCDIILGGVTHIVVSLLSLGADQTSNVNLRVTTDCITAVAFYLDKLNSTEFNELHSVIADLAPSGTKSLHPFSSPQALFKPTGCRILDILLERKILRLVAVDEIHLFVHFAQSFMTAFKALRHVLFDRIHATPSSWATLLASFQSHTAWYGTGKCDTAEYESWLPTQTVLSPY
jgi:hypothetical protein